VRLTQRSFSGGELGPSLYALDDLVKYEAGLALCRNFVPLVHGAVANRPGFAFLAEVKESATATRLLPFAFSTTQTYVLEFGDEYMRVYKDGGRVVVSSATAWLTATPYVPGDQVTEAALNYICLEAHTSGVFATDLAAVKWYLQPSAIVEIPTPYLEAELARLKFVQSADVMTLFHPSHEPRELTRTDHDGWALTPITFGPKIAAPTGLILSGTGAGNDVDYAITSVHKDTFEESLPATASLVNVNLDAKVTLQWTANPDAGKYHIYRRALFPTTGQTKRKETIYSFVGTSDGTTWEEVPERTASASGENLPTTKDPFTGAGNAPGCGTYFEQRLVTGGSINRPHGLDMSQSGSFHNFNISTPLKADDAIASVLNSRQVNEIRHFVPLERLLVLTSGGEWVIRGLDGAVTPIDFDARQQGYGGSSHVRPVVVKDTVILVQERGNLVRDLFFQLDADGYRGNDLTILAQHLVEGRTIVDMDYAQVPDSVIWCVRDDGVLLSLTYNREHQVWGWAQHDTDGRFEAVAVVSEGAEDGVYVVVRRKIGGVWKRYVERLHTRRFLGDVRDAFFVDSGLSLDVPLAITGVTSASPVVVTSIAHGIANGEPVDIDDVVALPIVTVGQETIADLVNRRRFKAANVTADTLELVDEYSGAPIDGTLAWPYDEGGTLRLAKAVITGLGHLEGKAVTGLANGSEIGESVVTGGQITLTKAASRVHIGLRITADLETLDLSLVAFLRGTRDLKRVAAVRLHVEDSRGGAIGPDDEELYDVKWRDAEGYNEETELLTGFVRTAITSVWNDRGRVFLRQRSPLPLTVLAMGFEFEAAAETGGSRRAA